MKKQEKSGQHKTLDFNDEQVYHMRCYSGIAQSVEHLTVNEVAIHETNLDESRRNLRIF